MSIDGKVRLANAVAGYVAGLYNTEEAKIDAGSRSYGDFRKTMRPEDREATDRILVGYLALKGALPRIDSTKYVNGDSNQRASTSN